MNIKETAKNVLRPLYRQYLAFRNRGDSVKCNICGRDYKRLRPIYGRHFDGNLFLIPNRVGSCWLCNSYPRNRELYYWLVNDFDILNKKYAKILHIAPELPISNRIRKLSNIDYTCIDKHCEGYAYPKYVEDGDVCALRFPDKTFDLIICNHVLEHIIDDTVAMKEIFRVLKPDGIAILMVPIDMDLNISLEERKGENLTPMEREQRFGQFDHVRIYGKDYFERLGSIGFQVERKIYDDKVTNKHGFTPNEEIIICRRSE